MDSIPLGLSYDDVLLVPQHSLLNSRSEVDLSTQITPHVKLTLPLLSINMTDVTGVEMAIALGKLGGLGLLPRFVSAEEQADQVTQIKKNSIYAAAAIGVKEGELERADMLVKAGVDLLTIDIAHGHMQKAIETTSLLKNKYKNIDIVPGVIATYEGAYDLFKAGADSVRVGVGPGTICITRVVTGVGVPQITAVMEATRAARKFGRTILCDGGTKNTGDIMKGLAAGASAVIIGSQFAGCLETPGKVIEKDGKQFKVYNASTSHTEKTNHVNKLKSKISKNYINYIEGVESVVPYKGPVKDVVAKMDANLRAGYSYLGSKNINAVWKKAQFIQVTAMGVRENSHHDVIAQ